MLSDDDFRGDFPRRGRPKYLITIDTEGDDQWSKNDRVTTENSRFLPRFQALCERFGFKPTYLVNYEMAICPIFVEFAKGVLRRGAGEIGMHLHGWHSPPEFRLSENDYRCHPYLTDYPEDVMEAKIAFMTDLLRDTFGERVVSHRAGRWGFNEVYARLLADRGYLVDCSVTPGISWRKYPGAPNGPGGPDFTSFPVGAYTLDLDDISKPGDSPLIEVPLTVRRMWHPVGKWLREQVADAPKLLRAPVNRLFPPIVRLQPTGKNLRWLLALQRHVLAEGGEYIHFTLHSSEFMPGGSPTFTSPGSIEKLYDDLHRLFDEASRHYEGASLQEYHREFTDSHSPAAGRHGQRTDLIRVDDSLPVTGSAALGGSRHRTPTDGR